MEGTGLKQQVSDLTTFLAARLTERGALLATAESCTGGLIASYCTQVPGASQWYAGGVVTYTHAAKRALLGIPEEILEGGLVTRRTAEAMARAVVLHSGATCGIATTGVCGPDASEGIDPLSVWIAIVVADTCTSVYYQDADEGREVNKLKTTLKALRLLIDRLIDIEER